MDAAGITSGIDLARVCFDKDVGWKEKGIVEEVQSLIDTLNLEGTCLDSAGPSPRE